MATRKSAIIPYRFRDNKLEILLITKTNSGKWGIPKGNIEAPLKPHISATKEAFEEAGVLGRPHPITVGSYDDTVGGSGPIPTFLLEVDVELGDWQEKDKRSRRWIDADDCADYLEEDDLLKVVKRGIRCLRSDGEYFKRVIKTYCEDYGWKLLEADEDEAEMEYQMTDGNNKRIFITRHDSTVEFSVPSFVVFKSEDDLPHGFSTVLLRRNAQKKLGFWCIDQTEEQFVYTCMHNSELNLLDSRYFARIVEGLIEECDAIEGIIEDVSEK